MCYETLISIRDCGENAPPKSGLYADDFGVTLNDLQNLITADFADGYDLFSSKRKAAWDLLTSEVNSKLAHWMKADTIIDNNKIGYVYQDGFTPALGVGNYIGASMRLYNRNSFSSIFISDIIISADVDEAVNVQVIDLWKNKILDTFKVNTNELTVVGKEYMTNRNDAYLAVVYESTFSGQKTTVRKGVCGSCGGGYNELWLNGKIQARAIKGNLTGETFSNLSGFGYTGGLQVNYSVNCDRSAWVCSNSKMFALAHLFKTMALCMEFGLLNSINERANTTVTINAEALQQRFDAYMSSYEKQMNVVLSNMTMPKDKDCFRCNENIKWGSMLP